MQAVDKKKKHREPVQAKFALGSVFPPELLKQAAGGSKAKHKWLKRRYRPKGVKNGDTPHKSERRKVAS